jgi:hypothetical protein
MEEKNYITAFCKIKSGEINVNHSITFSDKTAGSSEFIKAVYKHYQMNYPKFYKMDKLCQLAFTASELLLKENKLTEKYSAEDIAVIISNHSSSLESDTEHQRSIEDKDNHFPSPAVFVYTLPNILIGEIAIRNNIKGENTFFIFDKFDASFMSTYVDSLLNTNKAQCCIGGWVDFFEDKYEAFLYTVEKSKTALSVEHTSEQLNNLYK